MNTELNSKNKETSVKMCVFTWERKSKEGRLNMAMYDLRWPWGPSTYQNISILRNSIEKGWLKLLLEGLDCPLFYRKQIV